MFRGQPADSSDASENKRFFKENGSLKIEIKSLKTEVTVKEGSSKIGESCEKINIEKRVIY